jgi:Hsp70 protein
MAPSPPEAWRRLVAPTTAAERRHFTQLCADVRLAKEALSRQLAVGLHIPLVEHDVRIGREEFESAAEPLLARTVDLSAGLLTATGTPTEQVGEVLLLGGSSRIPLVTTLLYHQFGFAPTACNQPELAVAEGALTVVSRTPVAPLEPTEPATVELTEPATVELTGLAPLEPTGPARLEPTWPAPREPVPAATSSVAGAAVRHRRPRVFAVAAGLALVVALAGLFVTRLPKHEVPGGGPAVSTGPQEAAPPGGTGVLASAPGGTAPTGPARGSTSTTPTPTASPSTEPTSPAATTGPPPVAVSVTVNPTSGTCSTDFTFVAHFTVNVPRKYRWHWELGGPNQYSWRSGDHDRDKTGDEHITKKFDAAGSGTYWALVQVTSPVTVASSPATVEVVCNR